MAIQQFNENRAFVLITGDRLDPTNKEVAGSSVSEDDNFSADPSAIFNGQGNLTVLVSTVAEDLDKATYSGRPHEYVMATAELKARDVCSRVSGD